MEAQSLPVPRTPGLPGSRKLMAAFGNDRLVELVRRGSDAAFEVLYDRHHRGILTFCRHMLSSQEEAEDAVQHTFISAYSSIQAVGEREINVKPWLYTIARNRCLSVLRARREQAAEIDDLPTAGLGEAVQHRADLRELLRDIRELPEDQRAALVLSEIGDLSHAEIAQIVGCEASKVKSLVFQARTSLLESRNAREIPCHEIREQLANGQGGELRRGPLRKHVRQCEGCSEFRAEMRAQKKMLAAALPVIPTVGLKHSALAAVGVSGSASAAGGAAAGGLASVAGASGAAKAIALVACAGVAVSGGVAINDYRTSLGSSQSAGSSAPSFKDGIAPAGREGLSAVLAPERLLPGVAPARDHHRGSAAPATALPTSGSPVTRQHGGPKTPMALDTVKHGGPAAPGHGHAGGGNSGGQADSGGPGISGSPSADAPGQSIAPQGGGGDSAGNAGGNASGTGAPATPAPSNGGGQGTKDGRLGSNGAGSGNGPISRGSQVAGTGIPGPPVDRPTKSGRVAQDAVASDTAAIAP